MFPVGVPLSFLGLMFYYGVPRLADRRISAAWLQVALTDAWQRDILSKEARGGVHSLSDSDSFASPGLSGLD